MPRKQLRSVLRLVFATLVAVMVLAPRIALAQIGSDRYSSIVIDAATGQVLSAVNPDEYRFPASLTKMMTLYMLFEAVRDRRLSMGQRVPVSAYAASMSPTKLGLLPGTIITVEQAVLGLVTKSANDAAAALGELMGGDEERFAQMMTLRARALGMSNTTFRNASGLPDWSQVTTARDMALLGRRLVQDFPVYYRYFSVPYFVFQGRLVMNHQRLLQTYPGADGLKTGYIDASGFNVVTSAVRGDTRLVGVVMGAASGGERDQHMANLLDLGFDRGGAAFVARRDPSPGYRLPSLIGEAQAASFAAPVPPQVPFGAAPPGFDAPAFGGPVFGTLAATARGMRHFRTEPGLRAMGRYDLEKPAPRVATRTARRPEPRFDARPERRVVPVAVRATAQVVRPNRPEASVRPIRAGSTRTATRSGAGRTPS